MKRIGITLKHFRSLKDRNAGICLACGKEHGLTGIGEPNHFCDACGERRVMHIAQATPSDRVEIVKGGKS